MNNKPIINGIDVSECGFCCWKHNVNELIENYCAIFNNKCICNPDCYFKQLKRLQDENEKLKEKVNSYNCNVNCYKYKEVNRYKQALEKIRHLIQVFVPKKEADYNSAKKEHPVFFGLLEQIKYHCNEVLNDRD